MAQVEIYKLKKTVDPEIREHGMFEFFGNGGPFPENYVREWAGELASGNLDMLCGKFFLNPPEGYHSGPLEKGDIAVVNGQAYFLDRDSGYKFEEVDFDTSGSKDAIHVEYERYISVDEAVYIPHSLSIICASLDVPFGYLGEPGYHGSSKDFSDFERTPPNNHSPCYLHPQFLKGGEAREFVNLLTELTQTDQWMEIAGYLLRNYPVYLKDLKDARETFAPELLFPAELRPIHKAIPDNADVKELDYLVEKISGMDDKQRKVFYAVVEGGLYTGNEGIAEIINITENLDRFELRPAMDAYDYGKFRLKDDHNVCEPAIRRLEKSEDPADRYLAKHIMLLTRCAEEEAYGYHAAKEDGCSFTQYGCIIQADVLDEVYNGLRNTAAEQMPGESQPVGKKPSVMGMIAGARAEQAKAAKAGGREVPQPEKERNNRAKGGDR